MSQITPTQRGPAGAGGTPKIGGAFEQILERRRRLEADAPLSPEEEALALRRRIGARGGVQSTILGGKRAQATRTGQNVFKKNLGGTA